MSTSPPACRIVSVAAFRGDRTRPFVTSCRQALDDEKNSRGPGPTNLDCLLFAGHLGVSLDGGTTIFGFNPDGGGLATWQVLEGLQLGQAFPGIVRNDTHIFIAAQKHPLNVVFLQVVLPEPRFQEFEQQLDAERQSSKYSYGFPRGDGDCNCATWPERLGLPLLTGSMDEFVALRGISLYPSRRFGQCV